MRTCRPTTNSIKHWISNNTFNFTPLAIYIYIYIYTHIFQNISSSFLLSEVIVGEIVVKFPYETYRHADMRTNRRKTFISSRLMLMMHPCIPYHPHIQPPIHQHLHTSRHPQMYTSIYPCIHTSSSTHSCIHTSRHRHIYNYLHLKRQ